MNASSSVAACRPLTTPSGVSMTSTFPALISEMRSQRPASLMKWVETKMVTLSRRDRSIRCSQKPSRATGSTPEVGSSRISRSGRWINATASCRRCRWPSGSESGSASMISSRPNRAAVSSTRCGISALGTSKSWACRTKFCRTVSSEYSEKACDM